MKNFLFSLTAFLLLFSVSCKKDENTTTSLPLHSFSCKIDGVSFEVSGFANAYAEKISQSIFISGEKEDALNIDPSVYIEFPINSVKGTYTLDDNFQGAYVYGNGSSTAFYNIFFGTKYGMEGGSVTIEEINASTVKGTFQFTGYNNDETEKRTITEGKFNVQFQ